VCGYQLEFRGVRIGNLFASSLFSDKGTNGMNRVFAISVLFAGVCLQHAAADDAAPPKNDEAGIRAADAQYVNAFNAHDAAALANLWSPEAVYRNRISGETVTGRDAIAAQYSALFSANEKLQVKVDVASIQFISPNAAVEHGTATFIAPGSEGDSVDYTAIFIRRDGKWLLDNVTDQAPPVAEPSHYEHLKELEWMIGSWVDDDENARIVTDCNWTRNNNFISRSFTFEIEDVIHMAGIQILGWDAAAKQIRSWTFDSDGGFSEDAWNQKDNVWFIRKKGVTSDGRKVTAVNILKYVDDNTFTIQSVQRAVDGELLPNIEEARVVRR